MQEQNIQTYRAFWPFYVSQHRNKTNRNLHFVGTLMVLVFLVFGAVNSPWFLLGMPLGGYAFAWIGHFVFERNRPATFRYPFWSLVADFQMFALMCVGRMDREVRRMGVLTTEF